MKDDKILARLMYYMQVLGASLMFIGAALVVVVCWIVMRYSSIREDNPGILGAVVFLVGLAMYVAGRFYIKRYLRERGGEQRTR